MLQVTPGDVFDLGLISKELDLLVVSPHVIRLEEDSLGQDFADYKRTSD